MIQSRELILLRKKYKLFKSYDETKREALTNLYKYMQRVASGDKPTAKDRVQKRAWRQQLRRTGMLGLPFSLNKKKWRKAQ